jgi:hypothetical protein
MSVWASAISALTCSRSARSASREGKPVLSSDMGRGMLQNALNDGDQREVPLNQAITLDPLHLIKAKFLFGV